MVVAVTCRVVEFDGVRAIVCGRGQRTKRCTCCARLTATPLLCDWKVGSKTCDKAVCPNCATHVGDDKDLCRAHAIKWGEQHAEARCCRDGRSWDGGESLPCDNCPLRST